MEFIERTDLEAGFAPVFQQDVRPKLLALEEERIERLGTARKWVALALGGAAAVIAAIVGIFGIEGFGLFACIAVGMLGVFGALGLRKAQSSGWGSSLAEAVMPAICNHIGDLKYTKSGGYFPLDQVRDLRLVGSYSNSTTSDLVEGSHRGTKFEVTQAHLTSKSRDSKGNTQTTTVFAGLLFHIEVPMSVSAPILITRDRGAMGNKLGEMFSFGDKGRAMPKVKFDHDVFEAAFEVYSDDPDAAYRIMPPAFLDNLVAIGESEGGRKGTKAMVAGFKEDSFYLALSRSGGFMDMGKLTRPVTEMEEDLHGVFADIGIVHRIIDRLHGVTPE